MTIAIIGTNGLPARYGGFETLTEYLTKELGESLSLVVYCPLTPRKSQLKSYNHSKLIYLPFKANGFQSIIYDCISLLHAVATCDKILILGTPGAIILPLLFPFKKKFIVNFGGLEWKRDKWPWITRKYLKFTEYLAIHFCMHVVADNQVFVDYIRTEYNKISNLIEYGADHVYPEKIQSALTIKYPFLNDKYYLSVSRAQPDNNIHLLINAFSNELLHNDTLVVISNWNTSTYGKDLYSKNKSLYKNVILLDAIYDQHILDIIRSNTYLYIHSHSFCGTAPSLVEAMFLGVPVICFDAATNRATTEGRSFYFKDEEELTKTILSIKEGDTTSNLANTMHDIAKSRYTWKRISSLYKKLFIS